MAMKRGKLSKSSRSARDGRNGLVDALVVAGIGVSLGLVAVSISLNVRMGMRSADNPLDGYLYGAGAGFGDALKAVAPFMLAWAIRHRDTVAAMAAILLFCLSTAFSFTATFGFAAEHRASRAGEAQGDIDRYADLRAEKERLEKRLAFIGQQRPSDEVVAAMAGVLNKSAWRGGPSVGTVSKDCTSVRRATSNACSLYATLQEEAARAEEAEQVAAALAVMLSKLAGREGGVTVSADAQAEAIAEAASRVVSLSERQVGLLLAFLLACFIEGGSGLGLYMVTTPWRTPRNGTTKAPVATGAVDRFLVERVEPGEGLLPITLLHEEYVRWCAVRKETPHTGSRFAKLCGEVAGDVGIQLTSRGKRHYCKNLALKSAERSVA